ncbi:MAG: alpha-ribazole phosphatase family protein [Alkalilacustris sp.]
MILLRHTRPAVADGVCYGRTDLDLGPCFAAEAERLVADLPAVVDVVSSPLQRCRRLAEAIAGARGLPLRLDARLIEMDFGRWEGVAWSDIPRSELDAWAADLLHARPHGGETVAELAARAMAVLKALEQGPRPVLAVTHAGILKAVRATLDGADAWHRPFAFGSWERIAPD